MVGACVERRILVGNGYGGEIKRNERKRENPVPDGGRNKNWWKVIIRRKKN